MENELYGWIRGGLESGLNQEQRREMSLIDNREKGRGGMDIRTIDRELITWVDSMISSWLRPSEREACMVSYTQSTVEAFTGGTSYRIDVVHPEPSDQPGC